MERLTKRIDENTIELSAKANSAQYNSLSQRVYVNHPFWNVFNKLADYEDIEEQGLLLRLPCKTGDVVYSLDGDRVHRVRAMNDFKTVQGKMHVTCVGSRFIDLISFEDIGKTVFLTKEEAEQKLAERSRM